MSAQSAQKPPADLTGAFPECARGVLSTDFDAADGGAAVVHMWGEILLDEPGGLAVRGKLAAQSVTCVRHCFRIAHRTHSAGRMRVVVSMNCQWSVSTLSDTNSHRLKSIRQHAQVTANQQEGDPRCPEIFEEPRGVVWWAGPGRMRGG